MDVSKAYIQPKKIKVFLVFFCVCLFQSCKEGKPVQPPVLLYENSRPMAVTFEGSPEDVLQVYLAGEKTTPVLGNFRYNEGKYTFSPVVPFSKGMTYVIRQGQDSLASFRVPEPEAGRNIPELLAIYPQRDTVPENLLKCYLQFSEPMQAVGKALDFITVTDLQLGQDVPVFLDMEAELWDQDHRTLTIWLDPGRIKTDLIPNKTLGTPLQAGHSYRITVAGSWRSAKGVPLSKDYHHKFYVTEADRQPIQPIKWTFTLPVAGTREALEVRFQEAIDIVLARDVCAIETPDGKRVGGLWETDPSGEFLRFRPTEVWSPGVYKLVVDAALEDLAGNTVNKLFDNPLSKEGLSPKPLLKIERVITVD